MGTHQGSQMGLGLDKTKRYQFVFANFSIFQTPPHPLPWPVSTLLDTLDKHRNCLMVSAL